MFQLPWSNFHELNLDWIMNKLKELDDKIIGSSTPSATPPEMDGAASPGVSDTFSRGDHRHPTDTSRASASGLTQEITDRADADLALSGRIDTLDARVVPSDAYPLMDGAAESGSHVQYSRRDHRHPTDTSRAAQTDLQAEINDRINDVYALQGDINAVDAKINFSSAAPLMDSSSASSGSSTVMARADHVHPTDTSRASATDVATLQARMDAFAGSANPSDTTPQMDGVGSAGSGGNYSRGDHVHPSDTSKVSKSGDHMTGYLIQDMETAQKTINAIGWLRIAEVPNNGGTRVKIMINRKGDLVASETHSILLSINDQPVFHDEVSSSSLSFIDTIRYSNAGFVDIHVDETYTSDLRISILPYYGYDTPDIHVTSITGVSATPAGETILTTYSLHDNGTYTNDLYENGKLLLNVLYAGPAISSSEDLNDYKTVGTWSCTSAVAATLSNSPTTTGFKLIVMQLVSQDRKVQIIVVNGSSVSVFIRHWSGSVWGSWYQFDKTQV